MRKVLSENNNNNKAIKADKNEYGRNNKRNYSNNMGLDEEPLCRLTVPRSKMLAWYLWGVVAEVIVFVTPMQLEWVENLLFKLFVLIFCDFF